MRIAYAECASSVLLLPTSRTPKLAAGRKLTTLLACAYPDVPLASWTLLQTQQRYCAIGEKVAMETVVSSMHSQRTCHTMQDNAAPTMQTRRIQCMCVPSRIVTKSPSLAYMRNEIQPQTLAATLLFTSHQGRKPARMSRPHAADTHHL
jgi:hypothetical protein